MKMEKQEKTFKILSAEDDDDYFFLLKTILLDELQLKIELEHVLDGEFLIEHLTKCHEEKQLSGRSQWPDLIFLDLNMPKKNGLEALKEIREHKLFPPIPIVVLTVSNDRTDIEKSYNFGANAFIPKPSDLMELVETLRHVVNYWQKFVMMMAL